MTESNGAAKKVQHEALIDLTAEEKEEIACDMAKCEIGIKGLEAKRAPITQEINAERKRLHSLATEYDTGKKKKLLECLLEEDFAKNVIRYRSVETGEVVDERAMTAEDRELDIPFGDEDEEGLDDGDEDAEAEEGAGLRAGESEMGQALQQPADKARRAPKKPKLKSIKGGKGKSKGSHARA